MNSLKPVLRFLIVLALLVVLIPLFIWIGLAALGVSVVAGIAAWFAGRKHFASAAPSASTPRWSATQREGIIIDHE